MFDVCIFPKCEHGVMQCESTKLHTSAQSIRSALMSCSAKFWCRLVYEWQLKRLVPRNFQFWGCIDHMPACTQLLDCQLITIASLEYIPVQHQRETQFLSLLYACCACECMVNIQLSRLAGHAWQDKGKLTVIIHISSKRFLCLCMSPHLKDDQLRLC